MIFAMHKFLSEALCQKIRAEYQDAFDAGRIVPKGMGTGKTDVSISSYSNTAGWLVDAAAEWLRPVLSLPPITLDYCAYTRLETGRSHELHADAVKLDGTPNHTPHRVATALVYLSDGYREFDGGELFLPEFGMSIVAQHGVLVGMPTDLAHRHAVTVVTRGVRDVIAIWYKML